MKLSKGHFKKKILIIGYNSYLAQDICQKLSKYFDIYSTYRKKKIKSTRIKLIHLDLTNKETFKNIPKDIYFIINCASAKKKNFKNFEYLKKNNLIGSKNLIKECKKFQYLKKLIFISSISAYGKPSNCLLVENNKPSNHSLYGKIKYYEEIIYLKSNSKFQCFCLRLPEILHKKSKYSFIAKLTKQIKKNKTIQIYNPNFKFNNLTICDDISNVVIKIIKKKFLNKKNYLLNVASKADIKLINFINYIKKKNNSNSIVKIKNSQNSYSVSTRKITRLLSIKLGSVKENYNKVFP